MNSYENYEMDELAEDGFFDEKERFRISDVETANWAFRKLKAFESKIAENERLAAMETERIKKWLEKETKTDKNSAEFFKGLLIEYYISQKEKDGNFKLKTPYGSVSSRKQPPKWEFNNNAVESLKELGLSEFIRTKTEENPDIAAIKKAFKVIDGRAVTDGGEIIDGITIADAAPKINVKTA